MALNHETALLIATPPEGVDRPLWLYEICRLLVIEVNALVIAFFSENPPCSAATCPEMRASEWQYLCAVHDPPKSCCAIDYCCHTLDWASNVLTSQKNFPSRLTLGSDTTGGSQQGMRHLTNIFRRVYRIFAHAWFQHRASFWEVEGKKGLYIFFKTVCDAYTLIPDENYTISSEAEGITTSPEKEKEGRTILKKGEDAETKTEDVDPKTVTSISAGATTRRHKHTPSTGSAVTTIAESDEDDNHAPSSHREKVVPAEKIETPASRVLPNPPPPRSTSITTTAAVEPAEALAKRDDDPNVPLRSEHGLPSTTGPGIPKIVETPAEESLQRQDTEVKKENVKDEKVTEEKPKEEKPQDEEPQDEKPRVEEAPEPEKPKPPTEQTQAEPT